jgi:predicted RNA-binding Zn-ribbon protein involved in translation (DUF1610 family)
MNREQQIAHARKIDTEVARLYGLYYRVADQINAQRKSIENTNSYRHLTDSEKARRNGWAESRIVALEAEAKPLLDAAWGYDADHYKGWNRFFLVQHIHNSMHCSSFRPTTRVGWLPDVSGLTEAEAVAEHGATLCTICFPSAPVELTTPKADPTVCSASGRYIERASTLGGRGKYAVCPECGEVIYRTPGSGKLRKHKAKTAS